MKLSKINYFIYLFVLIFISCNNIKDKINWSDLESNYTVNKNINLINSIDTKINYKLSAPIIHPYKKNIDIDEFLKGFKINMYNNGQINSSIEANYGLYFRKKDVIEAKKGVIIKTPKNETIKTDYITWDQKTNSIHTDAFVTIQTDKRIINGYGLESVNGMQEFKLKKVSGTIYLGD